MQLRLLLGSHAPGDICFGCGRDIPESLQETSGWDGECDVRLGGQSSRHQGGRESAVGLYSASQKQESRAHGPGQGDWFVGGLRSTRGITVVKRHRTL